MVVVVDPGRTLIDNGILINDEKAEAKDIREMRESYLRMARSTAKVPIELQEGTPLQPFDRDVMHDRVAMVKEATAAEIRREAADEVILSWRPPHRLRVRPSDGRDKLEKKLEVLQNTLHLVCWC